MYTYIIETLASFTVVPEEPPEAPELPLPARERSPQRGNAYPGTESHTLTLWQ